MPNPAELAVRRRAHLALALAMVLAILLLAGSGNAQEATIWTETSNGGLTTLSYGPLDPAKSPLFVLSCFSDLKIVVLDVHKEIPGAKPGDPVTIELSTDKSRASVKAEVGKNETTGTTFSEASEVNLKPVLEVLRDPGPLTLQMGEAGLTLSDQGRVESVSKLIENCKVD
jgi:hypothetical protein